MKLTSRTAFYLSLAVLLWAGNAIVGRMVIHVMPPLLLNFLRWLLAFFILLPLASWVFRKNSPLWSRWKRYALLSLVGVGLYNALLYIALHTSTALNVTLVSATIPLWILIVGRLFFKTQTTPAQWLGVTVSMLGVVIVLTQGQWHSLLSLQFVPGDLLVVLATFSWAWYTWMLKPNAWESPEIRADWAALLLVQVAFGALWAGLFAMGEWALTDMRAQWSWPLLAVLIFIAAGPAVTSYRLWGLGVERAGPAISGLFINLMPLFAALLSIPILNEAPQWHHAAAFVLIAGGIWISMKR